MPLFRNTHGAAISSGRTKNRCQLAFFSSAATGVLIAWMENGFEESEEEMAVIFMERLYDYMDEL